MAQAYPTTLQETFNRGTFRRVPGENKVSTKMDVGPQKVRRRSTLRVDQIAGNILLRDLDEYNDFVNWYTLTLQDGVLTFLFKDPATANDIEVQFIENGVQISDVGFQTYAVQMQMEIVSE